MPRICLETSFHRSFNNCLMKFSYGPGMLSAGNIKSNEIYNHYFQKDHLRLVVVQKYILSRVKMPTVKVKFTAAKYVDIKTN